MGGIKLAPLPAAPNAPRHVFIPTMHRLSLLTTFLVPCAAILWLEPSKGAGRAEEIRPDCPQAAISVEVDSSIGSHQIQTLPIFVEAASYDPFTFARTLEEAALSFPDLAKDGGFGEDEEAAVGGVEDGDGGDGPPPPPPSTLSGSGVR